MRILPIQHAEQIHSFGRLCVVNTFNCKLVSFNRVHATMFSPDNSKPTAPPRRKTMKKYSSPNNSRQQQATLATPAAGEPRKPLSPPPSKPKPSRPEPPKFKPSTAQRQHQPPTNTSISPSATSSGHHVLLSKYYGQGNQYATAPSKGRRKRLEEEVNVKSTTIIYSREGAIYLNVAPKPMAKVREDGRPSLDRAQSTDDSPKALSPLQPLPLQLKQCRENRRISMSSVSSDDSKAPAANKVWSKSLESPRQTVISPLRSMHSLASGLSAKRVNFTKQPLPKIPSGSPRPILPQPYSGRHKMRTSESAEGYAYVDPTKCRYPPIQGSPAGLSRDLDGLDLNNSSIVYATSEFVCLCYFGVNKYVHMTVPMKWHNR